MTRRPDGPAILGLLILAGVLSVGALALIGMGREVPAEVWALVAGAIGAVGGWVGKTITSEPAPDVIPAPTELEPAPRPEPTSTPAVYPLPDALTRTGQ